MARPNKPWFRSDRNAWFVNIAGKRINLGPDKAEAHKEFHRLMSQEQLVLKPVTTDDPLACEILDKFLEWCKSRRAQLTYEWYQKHLEAFLNSLKSPTTVRASELRPFHVDEWIAKNEWSPTYIRGAMVAVQRAFKWAVKSGYLDRSALNSLDKPSAERRDNCPTVAEFEHLLTHVTDNRFRDLLTFAWNTGARPQEIVGLEPQYVKSDRIEFPVPESKGKKRKRVIYLNETAKSILERNGGMFRNRDGNPWTAYSINCRMKRLAKRSGKSFALYDLRHAFATRMLESGLDHTVVAKLLGHVDASMLCRVYSHVGQSGDFLLKQLKSVEE